MGNNENVLITVAHPMEMSECELYAISDTWRFIPGVTDEAKYDLG